MSQRPDPSDPGRPWSPPDPREREGHDAHGPTARTGGAARASGAPDGSVLGLWTVLGRLAAGLAFLVVGVLMLAFAALAGCCEAERDGWALFAFSTGLSFGAGMWCLTIVARTRWLPLFVLVGVGLMAVWLLG